MWLGLVFSDIVIDLVKTCIFQIFSTLTLTLTLTPTPTLTLTLVKTRPVYSKWILEPVRVSAVGSVCERERGYAAEPPDCKEHGNIFGMSLEIRFGLGFVVRVTGYGIAARCHPYPSPSPSPSPKQARP